MSKEDILDNKPAFQMRVLESAAFLLCELRNSEAAASLWLPCTDVCDFVKKKIELHSVFILLL